MIFDQIHRIAIAQKMEVLYALGIRPIPTFSKAPKKGPIRPLRIAQIWPINPL